MFHRSAEKLNMHKRKAYIIIKPMLIMNMLILTLEKKSGS